MTPKIIKKLMHVPEEKNKALAALENWKSDGKPRLSSYWFSFEPTGVEAVDLILSAVALAGKRFHSTADWNATLNGVPSPVAVMQAAAQEAARAMKRDPVYERIGALCRELGNAPADPAHQDITQLELRVREIIEENIRIRRASLAECAARDKRIKNQRRAYHELDQAYRSTLKLYNKLEKRMRELESQLSDAKRKGVAAYEKAGEIMNKFQDRVEKLREALWEIAHPNDAQFKWQNVATAALKADEAAREPA